MCRVSPYVEVGRHNVGVCAVEGKLRVCLLCPGLLIWVAGLLIWVAGLLIRVTGLLIWVTGLLI